MRRIPAVFSLLALLAVLGGCATVPGQPNLAKRMCVPGSAVDWPVMEGFNPPGAYRVPAEGNCRTSR
jgi:hypothetical protein